MEFGHEQDAPSTTLWVGNLGFAVSNSDIIELFMKFGPLETVATYSAKSYAFVCFKRVEDAISAKVALQGMVLRGSLIKIEFARPAKPCKHLWVGGVSSTITKEQLVEEFLKFGKIEDLKFLRDKNTAFVEFSQLEDAVQAMRFMNGRQIGGDQIRVDFLRSQNPKKEQLPDFADPRDLSSVAHPGAKGHQAQPDGQPSNTLHVGYPPYVPMDEQMLHNAMILFGEIERIQSFPANNYILVEFRSVDEARRAKEGLQGRLFNDPRITITFCSGGLAPVKLDANLFAGFNGMRPESFHEQLFGLAVPHLMVAMTSNFSGAVQPDGVMQRPTMAVPVRPLCASAAGLDPMLLALGHAHPSPQLGIASSSLRIGQPLMDSSADPSSLERGAKRSRLEPSAPTSINGGILDPICATAPVSTSLSSMPKAGVFHHRHDIDYTWRGIIEKGGTPVCHSRCVPIRRPIAFDLPTVINCTAKTSFDVLSKHCTDTSTFDILSFLPDSEEDFASYTEFLRYLGSKNRAGVAVFDDRNTLFLVPPSDFLFKVLEAKGPERLYGVVLKLTQLAPPSLQLQAQLPGPAHYPPMEPPKPVTVPQSGLSLTPELIATLASLLPANTQSAPICTTSRELPSRGPSGTPLEGTWSQGLASVSSGPLAHLSDLSSHEALRKQFQQEISSNPNGSDVSHPATSESDAERNQRYQSTLQFAANLLLQIQQQQKPQKQKQQQSSLPAGLDLQQ